MTQSQFTIFKSTDASAPSLDGTSGSFINVLNACLVTGYGSKAAVGWTKPYTSTSYCAVYRSAGLVTGFYQVDDSCGGSAGGREARVTGYMSMSAYNSGSDQFPTAAQSTIGGINGCVTFRKSVTITNVTRSWFVFADSASCYVYSLDGDTTNGQAIIYCAIGFGEFYSFTNGDQWRHFLCGNNSDNGGSSNERLDQNNSFSTAFTFVPRDQFGLGTSFNMSKMGDVVRGSITLNSGTIPLIMNGVTQSYLHPLYLNSNQYPTTQIRGTMRGFWNCIHPSASFADGDTFSGSATGNLAGRIFQVLRLNGHQSIYIMETSPTVETNS